ncbi:hypothetical protein PV325_013596 [Microctonus aethiopoides]|nr:hypothetical protein PV325_013596 [Microctonus aethiopoides]
MLRTFNCEIGAILICSPDHKTQVLDLLKDECPILIGHVNIHNEIHPRVQVQNFSKALAYEMRKYVPTLVESLAKPLKKVGVLISGNGTNLQALIVEIDSGAIIEQEAVPVFPNDTIETLQERVKTAEHRAYPKALQYLATERIKLRDDGTLQWND